MVNPASAQFGHQIIRASAGTGKTFALSNRYLRLLAAGVECQTILATTFSRKGAGEILDRIIGRLADAALSDQAAQRLGDELQLELSRDRAAEILHRLLSNLHRLEVSTLDSFFNRVAKAFSLELGLPPTWEIVEEQQIGMLEDEAIQQVLQGDKVRTLLHMLSRGEATRRVATMIRDVVRQVYAVYRESGPEPWDQLEPVGQWMPEEQLDLLVDEIQSIEVKKKQLGGHWELLSELAAAGNWFSFIKQTSYQNFLDGRLKYGSSKLLPEMVSIFQRLTPHFQALISKQLIERNRATRDLLNQFGILLEAAKDRTGDLRFDDVTERLQQFIQMWDTERFSFRLDHQIQHLLLDEFQDTSPAQWDVIRPFAERVVSTTDGQRSFFCVGDMKQAIFGWRGGVAEIFDLVDRSLPNLNQSSLAKSYRSSPEVIKLVNDVFGNVDQYRCGDPLIDDAIQQWTGWFTEHSTARELLPGYISIEMAGDCDKFARRVLERKDRARNENVMEATIKRVRQLARDLPADASIGVLVRTNREISELIFRLRQKGVEVSEEGGSPLTDSAGVELILSALRLADHPGDGLARYHLSHSPLAKTLGLEPETDANGDSNFAAAQASAAELRRRLINEGFGAVVEDLAKRLVSQATLREVNRLQQLVRIAYDHSSGEIWQLRPSRFVQFVREEVKVSDESGARVRVMTIHRSKGLEFDAVVLPLPTKTDGWAGQTPSVVVGRESPTSPVEIASQYVGADNRKLLPTEFQQLFERERQRSVREAMCVLYVALTRAVHAVHVVMSFGAKLDHKSPAGIMLATVCPDAAREEGLLYESGNPQWYRDRPDTADDTAVESTSPFYMAGEFELQPGNLSNEIRSGRGLPTVAPSALTGNQEIQLARLFESRVNDFAMVRGQMIHACFEKIKWLDDGIPDRELLLPHLRQVDSSFGSCDQVITDFYRLLELPAIAKLFSRQSYQTEYLPDLSLPVDLVQEANRLEVQTERPFAVETQDGFSRGVIDRMITVHRGDQLVAADLIDIKTDDVSGGDLHDRIGQYRAQLGAYRQAASQFLGLPINRISTRLVFVSSGQVVNIETVEGTGARPGIEPKNEQRAQPRQPKLNRAGRTRPEQKPKPAEPPADEPPVKPPKFKQPRQVQRTLWDEAD